MITIVLGNIGCLTGDTIINVNRCKRGFSCKLEHLYKMFHNNYTHKNKCWDLTKETYVRSFNGERIMLHSVLDVVKSGVKEVFELELYNGLKLKATSDHEIMTDKGFIKLKDLKPDYSKVMCDTLKPQRKNKKSYKLKDIMISGGFHPFKRQGNVEVHRLIYESYLNNLKFIDYLDENN